MCVDTNVSGFIYQIMVLTKRGENLYKLFLVDLSFKIKNERKKQKGKNDMHFKSIVCSFSLRVHPIELTSIEETSKSVSIE